VNTKLSLLFIKAAWEFYDTSPGVLKVILAFAWIFSFTSIGFILFLLIRRLYVSWKKRKAVQLRLEIEKLVNAIMQGRIKSFAFEGETNRLIKSYTNHRFLKNEHRSILINELISIYKTLSGKAAQNLHAIYLHHDLPKYSLLKLKSWRWYIKAKGIQELADMNYLDANDEIKKYSNHPIPLLRTEAQTALVKLANFDALRFLDDTKYPISEWQQLKFLHILSNKELENLPDFSKWLKSTNDTVVIFSLKLIRHFLSIKDSKNVELALTHRSAKVRIEAVETIGSLHNEHALNLIKAQYYKDSKEFKIQVLRCFMGIFKPKDLPFLEVQLLSFDYDISLAAAKAIVAVGDPGREFIGEIFTSYADSTCREIIKHAIAETN
jgi:hypothetical protein